jgi:hypothetical protein
LQSQTLVISCLFRVSVFSCYSAFSRYLTFAHNIPLLVYETSQKECAFDIRQTSEKMRGESQVKLSTPLA